MSELTGGYTLVSGERDGKPLPPDRIHHTTVRFTETTVQVFDQDENENYAATYELDATAEPWEITMTSTGGAHPGQVAEGLVEKKGDTIRLIYSLPGTQPPTGFKTVPGQLLFVMENRHKS